MYLTYILSLQGKIKESRMIEKVTDKKTLREFVYFTEKLYEGEDRYAPPFYGALYKELSREVLEKAAYKAFLAKKDGKIAGRILYTSEYNEKEGGVTGYFSLFDAYDDAEVAKELLLAAEKAAVADGATRLEGPYTPYDPDNRRGILVKGQEYPAMIFTSYNYSYYGELLEKAAYVKSCDTVALKIDLQGEKAEFLKTLASEVRKRFDIRVDSLDYSRFDRDVADVAKIFASATTEINYREAPSVETIARLAKKMRLFINPDLIKIARDAHGEPIGFCMCLPDFNQIIRKTGGKIKPLAFLLGRKKITAARGMLQYVVPEYQGKGVIGVLFEETYRSFEKYGITEFEGGTIMEDNKKSIGVLEKFGGKITKVYRLYKKELQS